MTDERLLVRQIQNGDTSAFQELVETHKTNVYYLALDLHGNHHDAEDLSQEVFMKAYKGINKFRGGAKISSWLYRITLNTYLSGKRKKADSIVTLVNKQSDDAYDPIESAADLATGNPERAAVSRGISEHVNLALDGLSQQERAVFVMRHYHDMPLKDISSALEVAEGTVKSLLFRSIRKLREHLSFYKDELGLEDPAK